MYNAMRVMHLLYLLYLFRPYNAIPFCASVPCYMSGPYSTQAWTLQCGRAPCIPVIFLTPPHCPALPEGLRMVLYSLLVQDGLNLGLADFWRQAICLSVCLSQCWFHAGITLHLCYSEGCIMFSRLLRYIRLSYHEDSHALWFVNVQTHYSDT